MYITFSVAPTQKLQRYFLRIIQFDVGGIRYYTRTTHYDVNWYYGQIRLPRPIQVAMAAAEAVLAKAHHLHAALFLGARLINIRAETTSLLLL